MTARIAGRRLVGGVEVPDTGWFLAIHFNHSAVAAEDKQQSATLLSNLLGLPEPTAWGPFLSVTLGDGVRLDYAEPVIEFPGQHYALLVTDDVFDRAPAMDQGTDVVSATPPAPRARHPQSVRSGACGRCRLRDLSLTSRLSSRYRVRHYGGSAGWESKLVGTPA
jgi:hypothetical protein